MPARRNYLFWTLWDRADQTTYGYCPRTFVHCSDNPMNFHNKPVLAEYTVHAPEIIQDEKRKLVYLQRRLPAPGHQRRAAGLGKRLNEATMTDSRSRDFWESFSDPA